MIYNNQQIHYFFLHHIHSLFHLIWKPMTIGLIGSLPSPPLTREGIYTKTRFSSLILTLNSTKIASIIIINLSILFSLVKSLQNQLSDCLIFISPLLYLSRKGSLRIVLPLNTRHHQCLKKLLLHFKILKLYSLNLKKK